GGRAHPCAPAFGHASERQIQSWGRPRRIERGAAARGGKGVGREDRIRVWPPAGRRSRGAGRLATASCGRVWLESSAQRPGNDRGERTGLAASTPTRVW